jgi:hypothetical protein
LIYRGNIPENDFLSRPGRIIGGKFIKLARSINGSEGTAKKWVKALEYLTLRTDLRCLTMLTWTDVVAARHLFRPNKAWCPSCYEEWYRNDRIVYAPLLWSINAVTACVRHVTLLRERCHHCGRQHSYLTACLVPGYCPYCKQWLGRSENLVTSIDYKLRGEQLKWQSWVAEHLGRLLASVPYLVAPPL